MSTLCGCLERWKALKTFHFLYNVWNGSGNTTNSDFVSTLASALSKSPSLTTLVVDPSLSIDYLELIATNKNLKQILVKSPPAGTRWVPGFSWFYDDYDDYEETSILDSFYEMLEEADHKAIRADKRLKALVVYEGMPPEKLVAPKPTTSSNPFFTPLAGAAEEVKEKIWAKIIRFATEPDRQPEPVPYYQSHSWNKRLIMDERGKLMASSKNRLAIASVCKQFQRLTECYLYMDPELSTLDAIIKFAALMKRRPELTSHIRTLTFRRSESEDLMDDFFSCFMSDTEEPSYGESDEALKSIISAATNLISLKQTNASYAHGVHAYWLPWYILQSFSYPGETKIKVLEGLYFSMPFSQSGFFVLGRFSRLIHLDITVEMSVQPSDEDTEIPAPDNLCLPALEKLTYAEEELDPRVKRTGKSLFSALARFELPAFHTLNLRSQVQKAGCLHEFLAQHGAKILDLGVDGRYDKILFLKYCTNLRSISIRTNSPPPNVSFFKSPEKPLKTLEIIKATGSDYHTELWKIFFGTVDLKDFPALKEFRVECCHWPTTERELLKGKNIEWVRRSERLMKEFNVKLTDSDGKHWIPRLSTKTIRQAKK